MESLTVHPAASVRGALDVPGDKSISHRALMLGGIADGATRLSHMLDAEDCRATQRALMAMGVPIIWTGDDVVVEGRGLRGLTAPAGPLDCGNSGTTMRLMLGLLAGQPFSATLTGDPSLSKRPMARVTHLLRTMGATIDGGGDANFAPLTIRGGAVKAIEHAMAVPSAQVKSALLLAGLSAAGQHTVIKEAIPTRDHTERMLLAMGQGDALSIIGDPEDGRTITLRGGQPLTAQTFRIPGDISSAAFWLVAAAIRPGSSITVRDVGLNPTRTAALNVLCAMGAAVTIRETSEAWEPRGDVTVEGAPLHGTTISRAVIPRLIDELPILMIAAAAANGRTVIEGAGELRVKETDRIHSMVTGLQAVGGRATVDGETVIIEGPTKFRGATINSYGDHRTAMSFAIAGLAAAGPMQIDDVACIRTSYPAFPDTLRAVARSR